MDGDWSRLEAGMTNGPGDGPSGLEARVTNGPGDLPSGLEGGVTGGLATPLVRRPYRRRPEAEWLQIERLYVHGATAKALAERFGGSERAIYARLRRRGLLRRDQAAGPLPVVDTAGREDALDLSVTTGGAAGEAEAPCRALGEEATLGEAAAAAAQSAIRWVRELNPAKAYTWARLAGQLERLARAGGPDGAALGEDPTEPGRRAALDFLRREGVL